MDSNTVRSLFGEFFGTLSISAAFTAALYTSKKNDMGSGIILIIAAVVVAILVFHQWSQVHLNPLVSIGDTLTQENPDWLRLLSDLVFQIAGGICGVYFTAKLLDVDVQPDKDEEEYVKNNKLRTIILDAVFTFALVMAYMALTTDFASGLMLGIGTALVYAFSVMYSRCYSGGNINYPNRLGIAIASRNFTNLFIYTIGPLVGALVAVLSWYVYKGRFFHLFGSCAPSTANVYINESTGETREFETGSAESPPAGEHGYAYGTGHMMWD